MGSYPNRTVPAVIDPGGLAGSAKSGFSAESFGTTTKHLKTAETTSPHGPQELILSPHFINAGNAPTQDFNGTCPHHLSEKETSLLSEKKIISQSQKTSTTEAPTNFQIEITPASTTAIVGSNKSIRGGLSAAAGRRGILDGSRPGAGVDRRGRHQTGGKRLASDVESQQGQKLGRSNLEGRARRTGTGAEPDRERAGGDGNSSPAWTLEMGGRWVETPALEGEDCSGSCKRLE
ncbi:hypothetical protein KSP39_PZI004934 [Platanthera zijinensis]|uniref:Uncharacterized protein n=1 Tax=Platanthera zijinensis TaxID=2320716 RepID=A0AAP0BWU7_9ASPA